MNALDLLRDHTTRVAVVALAAGATARRWRPLAAALWALSALDWLALLTRRWPRADLAAWALCVVIPPALAWWVLARRKAWPLLLLPPLAALTYPHHYTLALQVVLALASVSVVAAWTSRRAPLDARAAACAVLALADPVDLLGSHLAGDPWRDHYVHLWIVAVTYVLVGALVLLGAPRGRDGT